MASRYHHSNSLWLPLVRAPSSHFSTFGPSLSGCVRLYNGSFAQPDFKLTQPDELGPTVAKWEDGARTNGDHNEFEWWYLDA